MIIKIANSPRLRLAATLVMTVLIGILSSVLASQIMPNGVLDWILIPQVSSFWVLLIISSAWVYIQVRFLNHDESILNFLDDNHCKAYIRKTKLEGLALFIKQNPQQAELVDAVKFMKNLKVK